MGDTGDGVFIVYDVKPIQSLRYKLGQYTVVSGLFSCEGGLHFAQMLELVRPPLDNRGASPKLHMYRCSEYPKEIRNMIEQQSYLSSGRRDEPRWVGDDVWSYGDGNYWTRARGKHRLIPSRGSHGLPASSSTQW